MCANVLQTLLGFLQLPLLPLAEFLAVLNRLFKTGDLCAEPVVATLDVVERLALFPMLFPGLLDARLDLPQGRDGGLKPRLLLRQQGLAVCLILLQIRQAKREEFRLETPLLLLQVPVALRGASLPLEMADLLVDFFAQVVEALEVLPRVAHPGLGLPATLLVFRDARCFLEIGPQFLGLGFDQPGDHPLLDDRVAPRTQPGAQEQPGDVLAPTAGAVQKVGRRPIPGNDSFHRNLGVARVLPAD